MTAPHRPAAARAASPVALLLANDASAASSVPCPRGTCDGHTFYEADPLGRTVERCTRCTYRQVITGRPVPPEPEPLRRDSARACGWCGTMIPADPNGRCVRRFCGDDCMARAAADLASRVEYPPRPAVRRCPCGCGQSVPKQRKYATLRCAQAMNGRRESEKAAARRAALTVPCPCGCDRRVARPTAPSRQPKYATPECYRRGQRAATLARIAAAGGQAGAGRAAA